MLRTLEAKARNAGMTGPEYVRSLVERDLLADKTFDEIVRPDRADVRKRGVTEAQLDQIVERARSAAPAAKRRRARQ